MDFPFQLEKKNRITTKPRRSAHMITTHTIVQNMYINLCQTHELLRFFFLAFSIFYWNRLLSLLFLRVGCGTDCAIFMSTHTYTRIHKDTLLHSRISRNTAHIQWVFPVPMNFKYKNQREKTIIVVIWWQWNSTDTSW